MTDTIDTRVRNAPRAVIVRDEKILLLRKQDELRGQRFALPGGSQEHGETLSEALKRECLEEIGTEIIMRDLLHVADYFKPRSTNPPSTRQVVEFFFHCDVPADYVACNGHRPDKHQVEVIWMPSVELVDIRLLPKTLTELLSGKPGGQVYLGTIN